MFDLWLCFIVFLVIGVGCYSIPTKVYYQWTEQVVNKYLDFKYRHYEHVASPQLKDYFIHQIFVQSRDQPSKTIPIEPNCDLRKDSFILSCREMSEKFPDLFTNASNRDLYIYVHFMYHEEMYVFPFKYTPDKTVTFPLYQALDLDTSIKQEFDQIKTERYSSEIDGIAQVVGQFAGPKGTFYSDIGYIVTPSMICGLFGDYLLENEHDSLTLTTMLGGRYVFRSDQRICTT
jgi:hypothetical protein